MSEKKYYCYCDSNCKYETMTKEQILAAIAQAVAGGNVFDTEAAIISKVKEMNAGDFVTFWVGTQAQYNALPIIDAKCVYIITDNTWQHDVETLFQNHVSAQENPHGVTAEMIGAAPAYSYGTNDLVAGVSKLEKGKLHFVYAKE